MVQVNWTLLAINDLKEIYDYIAKDSKKYAKLEILKIKSRTQTLKLWPLNGKEVEEKGNAAIRELVEGNYRIIYKIVNEKRIDILTIHHSARALEKRNIDA